MLMRCSMKNLPAVSYTLLLSTQSHWVLTWHNKNTLHVPPPALCRKQCSMLHMLLWVRQITLAMIQMQTTIMQLRHCELLVWG